MSLVLKLRITGPDGAGTEAVVLRSPAIIGRGTSVDVAITDQKASRQHAELVWDTASIAVTDLKSRNGTTVDGSRIATKLIEPGGVITIGDTRITVLGVFDERDKGRQVEGAPHQAQPTGGKAPNAAALAITVLLLAAAGGAIAFFGLGGGATGSGRIASAPPSPERVGKIAERDIQDEIDRVLAAAESAASAGSSMPVSPDTLFAEFVQDGTVTVVEERVLESDDSLVVVTYELVGPDLDGPMRWDVCFRRYPGGAEIVQMPLSAYGIESTAAATP